MTKDKDGLSLDPLQLDKGWYYEEKDGVTVCIDFVAQNKRTSPAMILIPWRKLKASLKRKYPDLTTKEQ